MRIRHFEALRPICPVCGRDTGETQPLALATVLRREGDVVLEGLLLCPGARCQREYPIIDGIPLLIAGLRQYLSDHLLAVIARQDLSETMESVLGDCSGPSSPFDLARQQLGSYAWDHYGAFDPDERVTEERPGAPCPGSARRLLDAGLDLAGCWPSGPIMDLGCSVGGTTFALAERSHDLVLGVDLSFGMLRLASSVLLGGEVRYPRKRCGLVYQRRSFACRPPRAENVDFWACDALALPLVAGTFGLVVALNLLDCVAAPRDLLAGLAAALLPGGKAILASPYDWSMAATPVEAWLGGHSQRGPAAGASEPVLRALLTPGGHPAAVDGLVLEAEESGLPWQVRLHDRGTMGYRSHLVVARKTPGKE